VTTNVYDIPERLKEVDPRLFVMLNLETQKFEVHVAGQRGTTLGCELPFDELDARAIDYVRGSMGVDAHEVAAEIKKHNKKLDQTRIDTAYDKADYKGRNAMQWANHHPSKQDVPKELIAE
jgi:copper chaperone CopZ